MNDYILSCCSTADLTRERFEARGISVICFHYSVNEEEKLDDFWQSMSAHDFYAELRKGSETRTAQVNIAEYLKYFRSLLESGKDVLHVCFSSGLSGSYHSAVNAARIAAEQFPSQKLTVLDSLCASSGYGLFMEELADRRDEGYDIDRLTRWAEENKLRVQHWFFSTDLNYYLRGGRISKASAVFGGVFHICPLLHMDAEGRLKPHSKHRGKARAMKECVHHMTELCEGGTAYSGRCYVCQSDCMEDALEVSAMIQAEFPALKDKVEIFDIGTTIGSHTGPDTVSIFYLGDKRA